MIIGNFLGKIQPNYFMGIRTPWTLADPEVWRETHRRSALVWVIGGLLIALSALLPAKAAFYILIVTVFVLVIYSTGISFLLYKQKHPA